MADIDLDELERYINRDTASAALINTSDARKLIALARKGLQLREYSIELEQIRDNQGGALLAARERADEYERVLEFYADKAQYALCICQPASHQQIYHDGGYIARTALDKFKEK